MIFHLKRKRYVLKYEDLAIHRKQNINVTLTYMRPTTVSAGSTGFVWSGTFKSDANSWLFNHSSNILFQKAVNHFITHTDFFRWIPLSTFRKSCSICYFIKCCSVCVELRYVHLSVSECRLSSAQYTPPHVSRRGDRHLLMPLLKLLF